MLARLWKGDVSFAASFWLFGVVSSPLFWGAWRLLRSSLPGSWAVPATLGVCFAYAVAVSVAVWRSSLKYPGSRIWIYLARLSMGMAWLVSIGLGGIFFYLTDFGTTSHTIARQIQADAALPYIGFWKTDCADDHGLAIQKAAADAYFVRFCGPGGCFGKSALTRTRLVNDPRYRILDSDTIGLNISLTRQPGMRRLGAEEKEMLAQYGRDGLLIFKRCK
jgi:hypothetical protein